MPSCELFEWFHNILSPTKKMALNIKSVAGNINDICTKCDKEVSNTIKMISA